MTTPTYTPRAGSLASQVIGFFRHNPDEELLLDDITDKLAVNKLEEQWKRNIRRGRGFTTTRLHKCIPRIARLSRKCATTT